MIAVAALAVASCSKSDDVYDENRNRVTDAYNAAFLRYVGGSIDSNQDWGFGEGVTRGAAFTRSITVNADTYSEFNFPSDAELAAAFPTSIPGDADEVKDLENYIGQAYGEPDEWGNQPKYNSLYDIYVNKIVEGYNLKVTNDGTYPDNVVELGGNYQNASWDGVANKQVVHPYNVYVNVDGNVTIKRVGATHFNIYILKGNVTFLSDYGEQAGIISVAEGATLNDQRDRTAANQGIKLYNRGTINAINATGYDIGNNSTVYNEGKFNISSAMSYSPGAGNTSYFINFGDGAELTAASMTLNSTCHFYTGGTVNISGETKVTQQGIVWINNGHYTTNTMVFSAHNGTFYNYCQLFCQQDCAFKDGQFNMMKDSYAEFGYGVFNNFHVNMKDGSGIFIKNGSCFGQQGAGIAQGFFAESGATAYVRLGGETKIPAHKGSAFQLSGAGLTLAYNNITWWEGFYLADTYAGSNYYNSTSAEQLAANKDERTTWLLNDVTKLITGSDFSKVTATPSETGCTATWKVPGDDPVIPTNDIRIMVEDLSAAEDGDFDFNDVVFDVKFTSETTADVTLIAAGGTLPLTVAGEEVHAKFGNYSTNTMINTNASAVAAKANAAAGKNLYAAVDGVARVTFPVSGINKANNGNDIVVKVQKGGEWYTIEAKKGEPAAKFGCDPKVSHVSEQVSFKSVYDKFTGWVQNKNVQWY